MKEYWKICFTIPLYFQNNWIAYILTPVYWFIVNTFSFNLIKHACIEAISCYILISGYQRHAAKKKLHQIIQNMDAFKV